MTVGRALSLHLLLRIDVTFTWTVVMRKRGALVYYFVAACNRDNEGHKRRYLAMRFEIEM